MWWIYYAVFTFLSLMSAIEIFICKKNSSRWMAIIFFCSLAFLILFTGLRWNVGNDFIAYLRAYESLHSGTYSLYFEPLFVALMFISPYAWGFFFLSAVLSWVTIYKGAISLSPYRFTSLLIFYSLFFITFELHIIRQGIAIGFVLLAIQAYKKDQKIYMLLLMTCATLFHYSSMVFILIFLLALFWEKTRLPSIFLFFLGGFMLLLTINFPIAQKLASFFSNRYSEVYFNSELADKYNHLYLSFGMLMYLVLALIMDKYKRVYETLGYGLELNIYICVTFLNIIFAAHQILLRINYYGLVLLILLYPILFYIYKKKNFQRVCLFIFMLLFCFFYINKSLNSGKALLEYHSVLQSIIL